MNKEHQMSEKEQKEYNDAMDAVTEYERKAYEHNMILIKAIGRTAWEDFLSLIDGCSVVGEIEVVDEPIGTYQGDEYGVFNKIYVDQRSVGDSGDIYAGSIYANYGHSNQFLKIPYEC